MDPFVGELRLFPFAQVKPKGWMLCNGQLLQAKDYAALYALIGNQFGGVNGQTFNLPDLRGRCVVGAGQGAGLSARPQGQVGGAETVALTIDQIPSHTHTAVGIGNTASTGTPGDSVMLANAATGGRAPAPFNMYGTTANTAMAPGAIGSGGGGAAHANIQPYLALNWFIATQGIFPSRPW